MTHLIWLLAGAVYVNVGSARKGDGVGYTYSDGYNLGYSSYWREDCMGDGHILYSPHTKTNQGNYSGTGHEEYNF